MPDNNVRADDDVCQLQARIAELEAEVAELRLQAASGVHEYAPMLGMILEMSAALRITRDVPTVLALMEEQAPLLFSSATRALIYLADGERMLALHTQYAHDLPTLRIEVGQGIAGRGALAPRAMLFVGNELAKSLAELSSEQKELLQRHMGDLWPPQSAIAASMRVHENLVGVLVLYNFAERDDLRSFDLPFVQALADLGAVAIVDARQQADLSQARALHARAQAQLDSAQAQLLQSARLAAVGELSASVAHEINNPLYAARNSLFLTARKLPPDSDAREYVQLAQDELGRIARIISRMRDFYRPTRAELEPTDINQLLDETLALVQTHLRHGHVQVAFDPDPQLPPLIVSADQIRQVVLNLILNACDAMASRGGTLTVRSAAVDGRMQNGVETPHSGLSHFASEVVVTINDTGVGIPPEIVSQLFTPFFTTKPQGTGLGLAISGHIVTQHGGHISVDSTPGKGSTFTVHLPLEGPVGSLINTNETGARLDV